MANEKHLSILKQGVDVWNEWRLKTDEKPDLRGADLKETDLRGATLHGVNLQGSNLYEADLRGVYMPETDLQKANLQRAELRGTNLQRANLHGANLKEASIQLTNLQETNLQEANLGHTIFFWAQLKDTEGLGTCVHSAPSNLDHFTIAEADPPIPLSFLRGCGLPDLIIDNVEALSGDAIQFYSCFISYSSENEDFAERLHADLQGEGVRCWFAPHDVQAGKKLHQQINEAIRVHDKLVLILSEASMESNWVEHEVRQARERERKEDRRVLFPIRLEPFESIEDWTLFDADEGRDLAREVREYFIPDFSNWKDHDAYQEAFDRLVSDLRAAD